MLLVAREMLLQFIETYAELYGKHHITSNVHNLSHAVDEVERFGELETFSAYPFESALGKVKRLLRKGSRPLEQVAKRLIENFNCTIAITSNGVESETKIILSKKKRWKKRAGFTR